MKLLAALLFVAATAHAQPKDAGPIPQAAVGYDEDSGWIWKLKDLAQTEIYQGTRSVAGEFPAMGWIGNCTATAVAQNVVFTASHCVTTGKRITFQHRASGTGYTGICTRHPQYNTRTVFNDYALCKLDHLLPDGSVLGSFVREKPAVGTKLLMEGFGAPNVGTHYWGTSSVRRYDGQDLVSCGPSTLGGGDSGGSLLKWTDDRTLAGGFEIYAVNSRGNNQCDWYNEVTHPNAQAWFKAYEQEKGVQLCGVSADCLTPPEPLDCDALYESLGACFGEFDPLPAETCREKYVKFGLCIGG